MYCTGITNGGEPHAKTRIERKKDVKKEKANQTPRRKNLHRKNGKTAASVEFRQPTSHESMFEK